MLKYLLIFSLTICLIKQYFFQTEEEEILPSYDPCGYVGTSTSSSISTQCLTTGENCCYVRFNWDKQDYYSCIDRHKMFYFTNEFNISKGFITYLYSDLEGIINHNVYSKCNNTDGGWITTPDPRGFHIFRRLEEEKERSNIIDYFWYGVKWVFGIL